MKSTFVNELGNTICIEVDWTGKGNVNIRIDGPESTFECELTKIEANKLLTDLEEFLW